MARSRGGSEGRETKREREREKKRRRRGNRRRKRDRKRLYLWYMCYNLISVKISPLENVSQKCLGTNQIDIHLRREQGRK